MPASGARAADRQRGRLAERRTAAAGGGPDRVPARAARARARARRQPSLRFADGLVALAARERDTLLPDYTYAQAAQPTTAGHWLLSFAYPALRDIERLRGDFAWVNRSPGGAGGVNGSRFPLDRARVAELLGFADVVTHTRDAIWQTDGLSDPVSHAAIAATGASRFAEDLELYSSDEFGLLQHRRRAVPRERADAAEAQPVRARGPARRRGHADRPGHGRAGDPAHAVGPDGQPALRLRRGRGAVELAARRSARRGVSRRASRSTRERAAARRDGFALATDAAEALSLSTGLDYRSAYEAVAPCTAGASTRRRSGSTPGARPGRRARHAHRGGRRRARADGCDARGLPGGRGRGPARAGRPRGGERARAEEQLFSWRARAAGPACRSAGRAAASRARSRRSRRCCRG